MANILLIDDHPHMGELLYEEFAWEGHSVTSVLDAGSARESIASSQPDLVLLDLYLQRETRWDVLADIKLRYPQLPVLIFTAYAGYMKDPRLAKADGFVIKSPFFENLKQGIHAVLNREPRSPSMHERTKTHPFSELQEAFG